MTYTIAPAKSNCPQFDNLRQAKSYAKTASAMFQDRLTISEDGKPVATAYQGRVSPMKAGAK